jgi:16S rRNA processing protein RimM
MSQWWLAADADGDVWQPQKVESLRAHGAGWVAKLAGVDGRDAAERLDGWFIGAPRQAMPETQQDEYYWGDLIGLAVVNDQGEALGKVDSLLESGAHQVLVVKGSDAGEMSERLLPFVSQVVKRVDVAGGRILVQWGKDW